MKILIIDDEAEIRLILSVLLQAKGYETIEAANGYEGFVTLSETHDVACVITDLAMPVLTGHEFVEATRKNCCDVPIIALSAFGEMFNEDKALSSVQRVFSKPLQDTSALMAEVDKACPPVFRRAA